MKLRSWLVAAAAGATLLAGCGSSSTPAGGTAATGGSTTSGASSSASATSAAPATEASGDAAAFLSAALTKVGAPGQTAKFVADAAGQTMAFDLETGTPQKMSGTMTLKGKEIKLVFVDNVIYMGGVPGMDKLPGGKTWLSIDAKGTDPISKALGAAMSASMSQFKAAAVDMVAKSTVSDKGTEVVDGVQTRHIHVVVPRAVMIDQAKKGLEAMAGALPADALKTAMATIDKTFPTDSTQDYFIDPSTLLPVKVTQETTVDGKPAVMTLKYTWGVSVSIVKPDPATVASFAELMSQAGG